eukprot:TRINITY_DN1842_c1_g1_i2.p3 TRINITY_DN1842_c1_g1~~TRINITY_DN1842_c1_g1_i2.p3  ORF type:complete len:100 (-),score=26.38 TRINITY_DN1842_c1_g1_i2:530-829(-)
MSGTFRFGATMSAQHALAASVVPGGIQARMSYHQHLLEQQQLLRRRQHGEAATSASVSDINTGLTSFLLLLAARVKKKRVTSTKGRVLQQCGVYQAAAR